MISSQNLIVNLIRKAYTERYETLTATLFSAFSKQFILAY